MTIRTKIEEAIPQGCDSCGYALLDEQINESVDQICTIFKEELEKIRPGVNKLPAFAKIKPEVIAELIISIANAEIDSLINSLEEKK